MTATVSPSAISRSIPRSTSWLPKLLRRPRIWIMQAISEDNGPERVVENEHHRARDHECADRRIADPLRSTLRIEANVDANESRHTTKEQRLEESAEDIFQMKEAPHRVEED